MLSGAVLITLNMIQRMFSLYPNIFPNYTRLGLKEKKKRHLEIQLRKMNYLKLPCWALTKEMLTRLRFFTARKASQETL